MSSPGSVTIWLARLKDGADLVAGTTVHEAELKTTTTGKAFKEVDLVT